MNLKQLTEKIENHEKRIINLEDTFDFIKNNLIEIKSYMNKNNIKLNYWKLLIILVILIIIIGVFT